MWKKEKMLVTNMFSFFHIVFYPSQNKFHFSATFALSSANAFNLNQPRILSFDKVLTLCQTSPVFDVSAVQAF